jgi:hypothetical protein
MNPRAEPWTQITVQAEGGDEFIKMSIKVNEH